MKRVLMIAPLFAPQSHAAVFRAHKLAKYLPDFGYSPTIVTIDHNYLFREDEKLLADLSSGVEIIRVPYIEPTLRGVARMLGRRTTASASSGARAGGGGSKMPARPTANGAIGRAFFSLAGRWPDRYWPWYRAAARACRQIIAERGIKVIYSTSPPAGVLGLASRLKHTTGVRWVADFRDPVGYGMKNGLGPPVARLMSHRLMVDAMRDSDQVVGSAEAYGSIFFDLYGLEPDRFSFIPTGFDDELVPAVAAPPTTGDGEIVFVGEFMPNQSTHVFAALQRASSLDRDFAGRCRLTFIGRSDINRPRVEALLSGLGGSPLRIEYVDHVPQRDLYRRIAGASACMLCPGRNRYWWTSFAKLVDYAALANYIIADVANPSEARKQMETMDRVVLLDGQDVELDALALLDWFRTHRPGPFRREVFTARQQAGAFAHLFDAVAK